MWHSAMYFYVSECTKLKKKSRGQKSSLYLYKNRLKRNKKTKNIAEESFYMLNEIAHVFS